MLSHCKNIIGKVSILFITLLMGCSLWSNSTRSIQLNNQLTYDQYTLQEIDQSPFIYRLIQVDKKQLDNTDPFLTVIEDCSNGITKDPMAITRQLLTGLSGIKFLAKESSKIGSFSVLTSTVNANLEDKNISISILNIHDGDCIKDLVVWKDRLDETSSSIDIRTLASHILNLADHRTARVPQSKEDL